MRYTLLILLCVLSLCSFSQNDGYKILEQDQRIEQLIQRQKDIHAADNTIDGFRIQIFMESGNDAVELANAAMEEFMDKYPDIPIYLIFGQPYYRLRVGDFRTRLEAEKAFQTLSQDYKKAFVTSDRIQLPYNVFCDTIIDLNDLEFIENDSIDMEIFYYED
ncbi:MAG: SPOR domain-containing protein [Bacteroidales bacterium]|nr:SPOR domain-containing protein [Bacteroidales bacterium]MBR5782101.1 SPOR domain-containing protein [Bacteroidales bacterium]